jgi:tetratricopeptide (TPR) repeat protein
LEEDVSAADEPIQASLNATDLFQKGQAYFDQGRYVEAYPWLERASSIFEQQPGADPTDEARCLCQLGRAALKLAKYPVAREALERSRTIREQRMGIDHPETAESICVLGELLYELEERDAGLKRTEQALDIRRHALGPDHPDTLESLKNALLERNGLARVQPNLPKAEKDRIAADVLTQLQSALTTSERLYGDTLPITGRLANAVAINLSSEEGLRYAKRALDVTRKTLGEAHPETASRLANYALRIDDQEQAIAWTTEALQTHERAFGSDNLYTGIMQLQLAELLKNAARTDLAQTHYECALIAFEHTVGAKHSITLRAINGLLLVGKYEQSAFGGAVAPEAMTLAVIKRGVEAAQGIASQKYPLGIKPDPAQATTALHDFVTRLETKHRRVEPNELDKAKLEEADQLREAANVAFEQGDYTQTRILLERALTLRENVLGADDVGHISLLEKLIAANHYLGKFTAIPPLEAHIAAIQRGAFGSTNPLTVLAQQNIWRKASVEGQTDQATAAFQQMRVGFAGFFGEDHPLMQMVNSLQATHPTQRKGQQSKTPLSVRKEQALANIPNDRSGLLAGLERIDWHALQHAYGAADDVPIHLKLLLSDDKAVEESAWEFLYNTVLHQGSLYPATTPVVEFLIRMLERGEPPDRREIIRFFLAILDENYFGEDDYDDEPGEELPAAIVRTDPEEIKIERAIRTAKPVYLALVQQGMAENKADNYLPTLNRLLKLLKG